MISNKEKVHINRSDNKPINWGRTLIFRPPKNVNPQFALDKIAEVWKVVAKWGRWCDSDLGEWPETSEAFKALPQWFLQYISNEQDYEIENWMDDLHDREWVWWNGHIIDGLIKIDLNAEAMPISTWTIKYVAEKSGGIVIYDNDWIENIEKFM